MKTINRSKNTRRSFLTYAFVIAAYIVLQLLGGSLSSSVKGMLVPICAYVVMALSLNLVVGISGELSLGHAGFMSVGAFMGVTTATVLQGFVASAPLRLALSMLVGALFAGIVGFIIGIPVLRLEIIKSIFNNLYLGFDAKGFHISLLQDRTHLLEGGKLIIAGPMGISGIRKISTFTGGFALVMVCLIVIFNLVNSRSGRAIMASRDNRIAAESVGINVTRYKMLAFVTSSAMAGSAGALFALNYSTIVANKFDFNTSILVLVFVVFGGLGNMFGSILAAAILTILPEALRGFAAYRMLIYAIVLILLMLATNSEKLKTLFSGIIPHGKGGAEDA